MKLHYNATGPDRKELVAVISKTIGMKPVYKGMPTCAYAVNNILVEKDGTVVYDERTDQDTIEAIIIALAAAGFHAETGTDKEEGPTGVAIQMPLIQMPLSIFTESQLQNLYDLVAAKGSLIKKALGVSELPINIEGKKLDFSWFPKYESPDEVKAYMHFVTALCDMARNQKRITAKEKPVDNDKYAFRCFLLRLGFIGNEYKAERKVLLRNLTGSSAFKSGAKKTEVETCE
jgi:hypothetical protein|uniref:Putative amidoligase enzyme n=1 Tax=Siphoviridae sp. ctUi914 TaxID=2825529 RepID=A0A8S5TXE6_9CAUD|nr:MAG TPA: putative amidoligase enzyme [Siphoviridae sp. ctUi914]